jgi:hypothetical protein
VAKDLPLFELQAILSLERGTANAAETLRRYAPIADEIGADGVDVDADRADLLLSGAFAAENEESAMHAMARPLLDRFGWREQDFRYMRNVRYAETLVPPSGPLATHLEVNRVGQYMGWEGATHGTGLAPDRTLNIEPTDEDVVARLFVNLAGDTIAGSVQALVPWLTRGEATAIGVDPGHAALVYLASDDVRTEAAKLGLGSVEVGRIVGDADHVIETATAADGTVLWMRRGKDPASPHWPGILEVREMVIDESYPTD